MPNILVKSLRPGMKLKKSVRCSVTDTTLLQSGHLLTEKTILKLISRNISSVEIEDEQPIPAETKASEPTNHYKSHFKIESFEDVVKTAVSVPSEIVADNIKNIYIDLLKATQTLTKFPTKIFWDIYLNIVKRAILFNDIEEFLYLASCLPVAVEHASIITNNLLLTIILGKRLGLHRKNIINLAKSVLLADIGGGEDRQHIYYGLRLAHTLEPHTDQNIIKAIEQHHEYLDGSGFPVGECNVHPWAQIIGLCNFYNTLTYEHVVENTDNTRDISKYSGKFSDLLVKYFLNVFDITLKDFDINGKRTKVISTKDPIKPIVMVESDTDFGGWKFVKL